MASANSTGDAVSARQVRDILKSTAARMTGKQRGADRKVRRHSYDVDDPRAKPFRPIGDGTTRGANRWIDAMIATAEEYDLFHRKPGTRGPLTPYGIKVLTVLLRLPDFKTGRLDPSYDHIRKLTGYARATIARALARLKAHGFLDWVRRTCRTDGEHEFAPQRKQTSNAYFFEIGRLTKRVRQRFLQRLRRREEAARAQGDLPPAPVSGGLLAQVRPRNPALASALDALGDAVERASS